MKKFIFTFMLCIYLVMYLSYVKKPPTDDEIFCAVYFTDVPEDVMKEPLMTNLHEEFCDS